MVKAAWTCPRRPTTCTRFTLLFASASSAWAAMSVVFSSSAVLQRMRAQSMATLPLPMMTTSSASRLGWNDLQHTNQPAHGNHGVSQPGSACMQSRVQPPRTHRKSGCPLYQATNARALNTFRSSASPGTPSIRSLAAPYASTTAL